MGSVTADELTDLRAPIGRLARERFDTAAVRETGQPAALDRDDWRRLAEIGVLGALAPADLGGVELDLGTVCALLEECGRGVLPGPIVWSCLAATVLDGVADGERLVTGALSTDQPILLEHGGAVDDVLILDDGVRRFAAGALTLTPVESVDPLTPLARLTPPDAATAGVSLGDSGLARDWFWRGACLSSAYLVGLARRALELGVEHARNRVQFGRPVGGFQAVKHLLADILVAIEPAAAAVAQAALDIDQGSDTLARSCAAAKILASQCAERAAKNCIQVHGGMGYAWESEPHLIWKRAMIYEHAFGVPDEHAAALLASVETAA